MDFLPIMGTVGKNAMSSFTTVRQYIENEVRTYAKSETFLTTILHENRWHLVRSGSMYIRHGLFSKHQQKMNSTTQHSSESH